MADREPGPAAPRLVQPRVGVLTPADPDDVRDGDDDLDEVDITGLAAEALAWTGRRRLGASRVAGLTAREWSAPGASIVDSVVADSDVVALAAPESGWWNVEVSQSRIGSAELYGATWRGVRFTGCRLGYVNLRGAKLTDVAFTRCSIDELDLGGATVTRLALDGSRIGRLDAAAARLTDVDLRGAQLADVSDLAGLRGAWLSLDQLLDLAPALAANLGINVV